MRLYSVLVSSVGRGGMPMTNVHSVVAKDSANAAEIALTAAETQVPGAECHYVSSLCPITVSIPQPDGTYQNVLEIP